MSSATEDLLRKIELGVVGNIPDNLLENTSVIHTQIRYDKSATIALGADERILPNSNLVLISTTGTVSDVSFRMRTINGELGPEIETSLIDYYIGQAHSIDVANDTAEAGKTVYIDCYLAPISLLSAIKRSFITGTIAARPQAFYASKVDYDGTGNVFETDQAIGTLPTLSFTGTPATATYVRVDTIKYQLTPANAVTYELYLLEDAQADDQRSESDIFFDSGAAQASGTVYVQVAGGTTAKLPISINLATQSKIWYLIDWSAAPGDTTGYIKLEGEVLF